MSDAHSIHVNGAQHNVEFEPDMPLLHVLRNLLNLGDPKFGCGLGQCGACTVLLNGSPIRSCVTPVSAVGTREVKTIEGRGTADHASPLQLAFIEEHAVHAVTVRRE